MSRRWFFAASALAVFAGCAEQPTAPVPATQTFNVVAATTPRYIVAFNGKNVPADFDAAVASLGGTVETKLDRIGGAIVSGLSAEAAAQLGSRRGVLAIDAEEAAPFRVRMSEPMGVSEAQLQSINAPNTALLYSWQWNLRAIGAQHAWAAGKLGSANVKVAILDTGLDPLSLDAPGLIDLAASRSFVAEDDHWVTTLFPGRPLISDLHGHGTNVASQVSSTARIFAGVTSKSRLLGVKVCSHVLEACLPGDVLQGFLYAISSGADVINMSLGVPFPKRDGVGSVVALFNRVFQIAEQRGVTVVVAAGNNALDLDHASNIHMAYCDQTHVICVSATGATNEAPLDNVDQFAIYSNFGRSRIDVAAPGGNYKLDLTGEEPKIASAAWVYSLCSRSSADLVKDATGKVTGLLPGVCSRFLVATGQIGTSQAAPHVAGLAALLVAEHGRNPALIRDIITSTADDLGQSGTDPFYGRGRVNVKRALGLN